jgi:DNA-binding NtrC family response regulator
MKLNALLYLDSSDAKEIRKVLQEEGFEAYDLFEKENILDEIAKGYLDIVFISCSCSSSSGSVVPGIKKIKKLDPRIEIVCIGTGESDDMAAEIIKCGAAACMGTPLDMHIIRELILRVRGHAQLRKEIYRIESALYEKYQFSDMVSKNPAMLDIFSLVRRVAPYYRTLLIVGDTGTGKEVLARTLHGFGPGPGEPFIVCNCSALVEQLIESELFGHVKGAFTGAVSDKEGLFEAAKNGTILLDEIGHMPLSFQSHLLRVLQDGEFRRVGSTKTMKAKCRVIAATNVDLTEWVDKGLFRKDLYYRLSVITVQLPPLRERKEDIPFLCRFFLDRLRKNIGKDVKGISTPTRRFLMSYDWPGNIRELENVIERAVLLTAANFVRPQDLPAYITESKTGDGSDLSIDDITKNHIRRILSSSGGNKTRAALLLGISRRALQRKVVKYKLE